MNLSQLTQASFTQSQTALAASQAERAAEALSDIDRKMKTNQIIFMLWYSQRTKVPVKKSDISRLILKEHSKAFSIMMDIAKKKLEENMGATIKELEWKKGHYIVVNLLQPYCNGSCFNELISPKEKAQQNLLGVVLVMIFMNGGSIEETELIDAIENLDLPDEIGDIKKLITGTFVQQCYITARKNTMVEPPCLELSLGERALCEYKKETLLEWAAKLYDSKPEEWNTQYQEVLTERVAAAAAAAADDDSEDSEAEH